MSAASIAMSDPLRSAIPMSAALREGASLTPSPVIPTISSRLWNSRTMRSFCSGVVRANTISSYRQSWSHWHSLRVISSGPLTTIEVTGWGVGSDDLLIDEGADTSSRVSTATVFTAPGGLVMMPHSAATACAVNAKSPVT
jgi:hypothetical protein